MTPSGKGDELLKSMAEAAVRSRIRDCAWRSGIDANLRRSLHPTESELDARLLGSGSSVDVPENII